MSDKQAVLFANEAFYQAFADGDVAAMEAVWARTAPIACIHPGWNLISGRDDVMGSWRAILESTNRPAIHSHGAEAIIHGDMALVVCYEELDQGFLVATNVFVREDDAWRMVHHQAGPTAPPDLDETDDEPGVMH